MTHMLRWPMAVVDGVLDQEKEAAHDELWASRLRMLVSTRRGERVMRPDYGCDLAGALFDPTKSLTPETAVRQAVVRHLPALEIVSVTVLEIGLSQLQVLIKYRTPNGSVDVLNVKELK